MHLLQATDTVRERAILLLHTETYWRLKGQGRGMAPEERGIMHVSFA